MKPFFSDDTLAILQRISGLELAKPAFDRIVAFAGLVVEANREMNLTSILEPEAFLYKHVADSLACLRATGPLAGKSLIDVGTGAGFPGMVLALVAGAKVTLMDATGKKCDFLKRAAAAFPAAQVRVVCGRAEELGRKELREKFDLAVARAFGPPSYVLEMLLPLVKRDGLALLMEGPKFAPSDAFDAAARTLGGSPEPVIGYELGAHGARQLVPVRKTGATPPLYPRQHSSMRKRPLIATEAEEK